MSEIVFPHTPKEARAALRLRLAVLAVALVTVFTGFSVWLGGSYVGMLGGDVKADARVTTLGDSLGVNSSVKFRGLRVGRVVALDSTREDGLYTAKIVVEDKYAQEIPASVITRVVPGTLFGAEYVELRERPANATGAATSGTSGTLRDGAVIEADTSEQAIRLMDTFSALYRVIDAVDPSAVDMAMSQLAAALDGRGGDLHRAVRRISRLVDDYTAVEPAFYRDLALLSENLDTLADVEPDLAATLRNSIPVAETISRNAKKIDRIVVASTELSRRVADFLEANGPQLARFLDAVAPTYRAFVTGRTQFVRMLQLAPGVLRNGATSIVDNAIQMAAKFSTRARQPYTAQDCPRYESLQGRNCR